MSSTAQLTFYHSPNTRSTGVLLLLEELGAPYELRVLNMKQRENREPRYLAINPLGKVPAVLYGDALVTEQVALYIFLADLFPAAGLAPAFNDALRGPYLRWLAYYGSCFEPAIIDRSQKREPAPVGMSPYGDFDTMFAALRAQLERGPFMLGARFQALDVLWGTALGWMGKFGLIPEVAAITDYVARVNARPAIVRGREKDAALADKQG
jgi:glutathione S-transferase